MGVRGCGSIGYRSPSLALNTVRARHFCGRADACACAEHRIQTDGATSGCCSTGLGSFRAEGLRFIGANFGIPIPRLRFERRIAALAILALGEQICDWSASGGGCGDCCFRPSALVRSVRATVCPAVPPRGGAVQGAGGAGSAGCCCFLICWTSAVSSREPLPKTSPSLPFFALRIFPLPF